MKNLSVMIILRILLIISFALHIFPNAKSTQLSELLWSKQISYDFYIANDVSNIYFSIPFWILALLNLWYTYYHSKKRNNGRILMKEIVIPEMNLDNDERESEITGKSAKAALSSIIVFSFILLSFFPLATNIVAFSLFSVSALPVIGLVTYFISYKILYIR